MDTRDPRFLLTVGVEERSAVTARQRAQLPDVAALAQLTRVASTGRCGVRRQSHNDPALR
jgi:hypothetical protein